MEFRDLKSQYKRYQVEIDAAIQEVIRDTNFIIGKQVETLEKSLAEFVGVEHCITCANGTDAMSLVMMAWDIKQGDVVFVPDFTFFSTGEVVSLCGAVPIFVDVDKDTYNMDPIKLEKAIKRVVNEGKYNPKVVIPVDIFGLPANHLEIEKVASKYGLKILEDAAQGFGSSINNRKAGSFGNVATTSFFPAKPLGCYGDGGAIFTNDIELAQLIRSLRVHGKGKDKYDNVRVGLNSRLDTIQAAVLNVKLKAFKEYELAAVNEVYKWYNERLFDVVKIPVVPNGYYSSFAQYTIQLSSKAQRDTVQEKLKEHKIPSMIYYAKPMHKQGAFQNLNFEDKDYKVTNLLCETVLSLPMHPYLEIEEVDFIASQVRNIIKEFK